MPRRAGIAVGTEQIVDALKGAPGSAVVIDAIRARSGRSLASIYKAAARATAPMMLAQYQAGALATASIPEIEQAYRDLGYDDAFDDALDEAFERLLELHPEDFFVFRSYVVHEIT